MVLEKNFIIEPESTYKISGEVDQLFNQFFSIKENEK